MKILKKRDKLTLSQKSYLRELELSTDEDLKKMGLKRGFKRNRCFKNTRIAFKKVWNRS